MARLLFDKRDYHLLEIVNDVLTRDKSREYARRRGYPYLHPRGIKEMAESRGLRIAHAVIHLLQSLEAGKVDDRLSALRSLRDEVLNTAAGPLRNNTARVLMTIMKELVRAHGDELHQLRLAHDFRIAATGNPRIIRRQLRLYHLLEMPEEWNQLTFDHHVHDVNTKGRKSSSHLIMDAWIKGIRRLRVIYYNYLEAKFAVELLEAAQIMGITVRIGIEFCTRIQDRYAQLIWVPRGFPDTESFLCFLAEEPVMRFMEEGKKVSQYQQRYVAAALKAFNERHRDAITQAYGFEMAPLDQTEFNTFVGTGQPSIVHLAEFIHKKILPAMKEHLAAMREWYAKASEGERLEIEGMVQEMNRLDSEAIMEKFLVPDRNPDIPDPSVPVEGPDIPPLLKISPQTLVGMLKELHSTYRITLNLSNLKVEDVLELLYDCEGAITRLEIFNLKDYAEGKTSHLPKINELQRAINDGNAVQLKRIIRGLIEDLKFNGGDPKRISKLSNILHDIGTLKDLYKGTPLKARMGSDSTGRAPRVHGMGLAVVETLPRRARREIDHPTGRTREIIPLTVNAYHRTTYVPRGDGSPGMRSLFSMCQHIPGLRSLTEQRLYDWVLEERSIRLESPGNIVTLGGLQTEVSNGLTLNPPEPGSGSRAGTWKYMNSGLKNILKILIGFIPAFMTFFLTKEWWFLAYFGAFIWFGITGLRNVLQAVLGGGGIRRSPLLRWNDIVSWDRITDSLLYTGFSVPLLDYLVKTVLLDRGLGITTTTNPLALYTAIALANGLYISAHNVFRGLPSAAAFGNFFRTVLSIPIAYALNGLAGECLILGGVVGVELILQKWAAIISKLASDLVAGFIEGAVDRYQNVTTRLRDYRIKLSQIFDIYAQLELRFPERTALELLRSAESPEGKWSDEIRELRKINIINALDLLYFWMYQPRARITFKGLLRTMSTEERQILLSSQSTLREAREISLMFADGLVGKNFSRALSFYLDRSQEYLEALERLNDSATGAQVT